MNDEIKPGVDPRFDAAFQRGFDQSVPIEEYVPPQSGSESGSKSGSKSGSTSTSKPADVGSGANPSPASAEEAAPAPAADTSDPETEAASSAARNPFLLFIGLIAVVLIAAGVWLFVRSGEAFNSAEVRSQGDYMSLDATIHAAPFIALLGAATAIGILFVFAARYRRRR